MLSAISSGNVGTTNEKRRRKETSFDDAELATDSNNPVLQGLGPVIKMLSSNADAQCYSSSNSNGLLGHHYHEGAEKKKSEESVQIKQLHDFCLDSTDSKKTQEELSESQNIFDGNFDLDDFISASVSSSPNSLPIHEIGLGCVSEPKPDQHRPNGFAPSYPISSNVEIHDLLSTTSQNSSANILGNTLHFSSTCNDAFAENLDQSRASLIPRLGENFSNRTSGFDDEQSSSYNIANNYHLFGKRENNSIISVFQPDNDFFSHNLPANVLPNFIEHTNGSYFEMQAHESSNWRCNPDTSNLEIDNDDVECSSNTSSNSRTESHDTDVSADVINESMLPVQIGSKVSSAENKNSSKKTAYNEKWGVKVFKAWCADNHISDEFERLSAEELNELLMKFWQRIRKSNGDYYGRNSLFNLRAMINKHLKGDPHFVAFDIVTDNRFRLSNECLDEQLKHLKGLGRTVAHKEAITPDDYKKLYTSGVFDTSTPLSLLRKVWFEVTLHFCSKGGESQEKIKKSTFKVFSDEFGRRYVARAMMKRVEGGKKETRMYDTVDPVCPVKSFEFYLSKLHPMQPRLFQQPRKKTNINSLTWYGKSPIGEKALQQMMANISIEANLSKRYTNHCIRTTAQQLLTESKKNYEISESLYAERYSNGSCESLLVSSSHQLGLEGSLNQNNIGGLSGDLQTSIGINLYHSSNEEASSSSACMTHYDQMGEAPISRNPDFESSMSNFVPLMNNPDTNSIKRTYFSSPSFIPPPTYNEHRHQKLHTHPLKRVRAEEEIRSYQPYPLYSALHNPNDSFMHTSNPFVIQDFQPLPSFNSQSCSSQTMTSEGRQNLTVSIQSAPNNSKRERKSIQKKIEKLPATDCKSENIATGFAFDLAESNIDFEKSFVEPQAQA